ncbi:MAG TPA: elongation factor P [Phototrophicaceae bacterium]|nr:elongation factor P [Phototrophicaceae bacterium]
MIDVNQLRKGTTFLADSQIVKVLNYQHIKPGRGNATIRVKVRNMRTGATFELTFNSGTSVQDIEVEKHNVQYLYTDGDFLTFMDMDTYEQPQIRKDVFGDDALYLKENLQLRLSSYEGEVIDYELPKNIDMKVVESEVAIAGDTAVNPQKKIITESGLTVQVPMFINIGDTIRINTEEGVYTTRVND